MDTWTTAPEIGPNRKKVSLLQRGALITVTRVIRFGSEHVLHYHCVTWGEPAKNLGGLT